MSRALDDQDLLALVRRLPEPTLSSARRREIAAEVMAHADAADVAAARGRGRNVAIAASVVAIAAAGMLVLSRINPPIDAGEPDIAVTDVDEPGMQIAPAIARVEAPPAEPASEPIATAPTPGDAGVSVDATRPGDALSAFRGGYEALRAGRYDAAVEAFDRATDPVVTEDAQFWAAIACERGGRSDEALRRMQAFVEAFPSSPRIEDARAAIARMTH